MSARADILGRIGATLNADGTHDARCSAAAARLANPPEGLVPDRSLVDRDAQIKLFQDMAEEAAATTDRIASLDDLPAAITGYLGSHNLPSRIKTDEDPLLSYVDWSAQPTLEISSGKPADADEVGLAVAFAGAAETGTAILTSGSDHPTSLNFLPENHIVVLPVSRVFGAYEAAWARLAATREEHGMPRTVNWITGPSRTGDIEQTLQLGVHGPRRLHIILVDDGEEEGS